MMKAILLSGGMDSIALTYWQRPAYAFTIDYGQLAAEGEIKAASIVCHTLNIEHIIIRIDCSSIGSGIMAGKNNLAVSPGSEWWPFRNQLLITLTVMKAIHYNISELMVASVKCDHFHKDGTKKFYEMINNTVAFQEGSININVPAIEMSTVELIKKSRIPLEVLLWAHSCHTSNVACGYCPGCLKHLRVKQDLKIDNQISY